MRRFVFVVLLSFSCALVAQTAASPGNGKSITLYVQVTDKSGAPVSGLTQQDFSVIDNKHPQNITGFQAIDGGAASGPESPVQVVLVIDSVDTPAEAVNIEREDVRKFLLRDGGSLTHPLSFVVVTETGTRISPDASRDGKALVAQFDQLETGIRSARPWNIIGQERLGIAMKAVSTIADHLRQKPGRKLVIWLSPGWPLMSGATVKFSPQGHEMFFQEIMRQSTALRQAGVTMYAVDPLGLQDAASRRVNAYRGYLKPVKSAPDSEPANLALQVLSIQSGGRVLNSSNDLDKEIADCVADANSYYVLSFDPEPGKKAGEYHELTVKVDKPDVNVRTRSGYYTGGE
jgi:VWFA-related protein